MCIKHSWGLEEQENYLINEWDSNKKFKNIKLSFNISEQIKHEIMPG